MNSRRRLHRSFGRPAYGACAVFCAASITFAGTTTATFDTDPGWEGRLNRTVPPNPPIVTQDFGFSATNNAGGGSGELGGLVSRSLTPAYYAVPIATETFDSVLTASGRLSMPVQNNTGGAFFGWFNSLRQGWRPWNALVFRLDGRGPFANVHLDVTSQTWRAQGLNAGNLPTPLTVPFDGSTHTWSLSYNPAGTGTITFTLDNKPPAVLPLTPELRASGASFNRFGLFNLQAPSGEIRLYLDEITRNGATYNFNNSNTGWTELGNRTSFPDPEQRNAYNFGYSNTNYAGGASPGEIGGLVWRAVDHQEPYYAAPVSGLSLDTPMIASGKVVMRRGSSDGGMYFGWFNKQSIENTIDTSNPAIADVANFMGVAIEGPSAVGWYFRPVYANSNAQKRDSGNGPFIYPDDQVRQFTIQYNPGAAGGRGSMFVTLDGITKRFDLPEGDRAVGATFDRFGIFSLSPDGHSVTVYFDDLVYTNSAPLHEWINEAGGNWQTSSNWAGGGTPNGVGAEASLLWTLAAPRTVYTDTPITLGTLRFDNTNSYVLGGSGSLTMQASGGSSALVQVLRGTHKINLPLTVASNTILDVASGATLKLSDPVTVLAGKSLSHSGSGGSVVYESILRILDGASVALGSGQTRIAALSLGQEASLDVGDGGVVIGSTEMSQVRQHLLAGRISSGVSDEQHRLGYGAWGADQVLVRYAWAGDADLNDVVDLADLEALALHWQQPEGQLWAEGDFDYDGTVTMADLRLLAGNWPASQAASFAAALASLGLPAVPIPEPVCVLGVAYAGMLLPRRPPRR